VKIEAEARRAPGGAANVAVNAAALGASVPCSLLVIGDDEPGRRLEAAASGARVKTSLRRDGSIETTVKLRVIGGGSINLLRIGLRETASREVLHDKLDDYVKWSRLRCRDPVRLRQRRARAYLQMIEAARERGRASWSTPRGRLLRG